MMSKACVYVKLACNAVQGNGNLPQCADCFGALSILFYIQSPDQFIPRLQSLNEKIDF